MSPREVVPIHRSRLVPSTRASADAAKAAATLSRLASAVLDDATEVRQDRVTAIVRCSCPHIRDAGERMRLFGEFLHRAALSKGIDDGVLPWQAIDDSLTCAERTETAREIAAQDAAEALAALAGCNAGDALRAFLAGGA